MSFSNACMQSHFSHVRLCATLWTAAYQAPLSTRLLEFSRKEDWSGLPFPPPITGIYIMITTLSVNGLNVPTKRHKLDEWTQKQDSYICCVQETHFRPGDTYRLKVRGWKKIIHANGHQKNAGIATLMSDKTDFKTKTITETRKDTT